MTIDVGKLPDLLGHQRRSQRPSSIDALELPKELRQRGTGIPPAQQRLQRMLVGIECRQGLDPQQGCNHQRLEATMQRLLAVMQQGKVVVGMLRALGVNRLLQQGHDRAHTPVLGPPCCEYVHANKRQNRCDLDERPLLFTFFFDCPLGAAALFRD